MSLINVEGYVRILETPTIRILIKGVVFWLIADGFGKFLKNIFQNC